ncbi:hypothetical protein FOA43_002854 [Brettanomyces nanus]|uniref:chitinase n=1 Tax=Eeniella nana TaxID=13502 RepID=A0A875S707_EENNA|nr:uncharacterized protein FOA43_002854 [Brettanomyces nanus]QPG75499.1 hypothetical protein FOA43_002854 [Brettanomyces nanus]
MNIIFRLISVTLLLSFFASAREISETPSLDEQPGYVTGVYYTEWSYFLNHTPSDLPLSFITNIYYAFLKIDEETLDLHFADNDLAVKNPLPFHTDKIGAFVSDQYFHSSISDDWVSKYMQNVSQLIQKSTISPINSIGLLGQLSQIKNLNPNVKISLSIGGAETAQVFKKVIKHRQNMVRFVDNIVSYTQKYGFDGIDIDWEYPDAASTDRLTDLMRLFREKLDSLPSTSTCGKYILTLALPSHLEMLNNYDMEDLPQYVTYFNLMGYDMSGIWSKKAEFQSQLFRDPNIDSDSCINDTIQYLLNEKHVNPRKIVLGMPAYGRTFNTGKIYGNADACAELDGITQDEEECIVPYNKLPPLGYTEIFDKRTGAAYASNGKDGVIVYDNMDSAKLKAQYVRGNKLAGGVWWDSSGDTTTSNGSKSLLLSFLEELGGLINLKRSLCMVNSNLYYGKFENQTFDSSARSPSSSVSYATINEFKLWLLVLEFIVISGVVFL